jgi:hypothetical protein
MLDYPDIETGGDFFGFWNNLGLPVIQYVTGPGDNSYHNVAFFKQDIDFLKDAGNAAYQSFGLQHIGSWHSHHTLGLATPSGHDCNTMANAINRNGLPRFFMILGNIRDGKTTINGFLFDKDNQRRYVETEWRILNRKNPFTDEINRILSKKNIYKPDTKNARLANLKTVNFDDSSVFVLDFKPEKWLGSEKGKEELKHIYDRIREWYPGAKMFVNEAQDLTIAASNITIIFQSNFPDSHPVIICKDREIRDDSRFEYSDKEEIVSYIATVLHDATKENNNVTDGAANDEPSQNVETPVSPDKNRLTDQEKKWLSSEKWRERAYIRDVYMDIKTHYPAAKMFLRDEKLSIVTDDFTIVFRSDAPNRLYVDRYDYAVKKDEYELFEYVSKEEIFFHLNDIFNSISKLFKM